MPLYNNKDVSTTKEKCAGLKICGVREWLAGKVRIRFS
jgi:hypothetical protein